MKEATAYRRGWAVVRLVMAALIAAAVIAQLERSVSNALDSTTAHGGHVPTVIANFVSFFTIQSNIGAGVAFVLLAVLALRTKDAAAPEPRGLAILLACVTTYMLVTGVVYNTLLRGIPLPQGQTVGWSNEILHVVIPLFLLLDLFVAPARRGLRWSTIWIVIIYPLVWVVYTLVRANLVVNPGNGNPWWYPYPFLDPHGAGGYGSVAIYVVVIAAAIAGFAALVILVGRRRSRTTGVSAFDGPAAGPTPRDH